MKKRVLGLVALLACGSALANEVLVVNTDADSKLMQVSYRICENTTGYGINNCQSIQTVDLKGKNSAGQGKVFARITVPTNEHVAIVTSVTSTFEHRAPITAYFGNEFSKQLPGCEGSLTGDVIALDTKETDTILCNIRDKAGKINTRG